ncbi:prepilin peptidase [Nostocoides sp. F2B08]|uniref:prepilin peptidase n=1 Tax=Nostocoides sp. F2B08 TaxID=2653936 RepID=UPI0012630808|nr:A24 family peptidase [Tetrasphaera sp. F2B08]KAB7744612.1 prepilin peptidase [Tetrasphaera sp. F2B08]
MTPALAVLALSGAALGWRTRDELLDYGYRIPDDRPRAGAWHAWVSWWAVLALAVFWPLVAASLVPRIGWSAVPAYLLLAWLSVVLVWIDSDVHRLPNGLTYPAYPTVFGLLLLASLIEGDRRWIGALLGMVALVLLFGLLWLVSRGQVGLGDVKWSGVIGLSLGYLGSDALVVGTMATFLFGGVIALFMLSFRGASGSTPLAYGPAMCAGAFLAIVSGLDVVDLVG